MTVSFARYGLAVMSVGLVIVVWIFIGRMARAEVLVMALFGAMLVTSVLGGLGAGLTATALTLTAGTLLFKDQLDSSRLVLLGVEGILLSIVGGAFRTTRIKASEGLAANLRLEQQILEIGDDERRRIGHDLHDGLGQHLTGISLLTETMSQQIEAGRMPDPQSVETITRLVSQSVQITRDLAKSLSPVTLEQDGLIAAIEELANMSSSMFGIDCQSEVDGMTVQLDRTRALHIYRIVQEAVNNSVRHGKAKMVRIGIEQDEELLRVT